MQSCSWGSAYEISLRRIFASYLLCAVIWTAAEVSLRLFAKQFVNLTCHASKPGLAQIPVGFALSLSITNCTRLLLNIRRAYYIKPHGTTGIVVHADATRVEQSSTVPIIERVGSHESADGIEFGHMDIAESLLSARDTLDPRQSVEMKANSCDDQARWQYELRIMKSKT